MLNCLLFRLRELLKEEEKHLLAEVAAKVETPLEKQVVFSTFKLTIDNYIVIENIFEYPKRGSQFIGVYKCMEGCFVFFLKEAPYQIF